MNVLERITKIFQKKKDSNVDKIIIVLYYFV